MRQITRCPFCETCFKVSHAQLSLSDGWVRCGKCTEVFDANQHLQQAQAAAAAAVDPLNHTPNASNRPPADSVAPASATSAMALSASAQRSLEDHAQTTADDVQTFGAEFDSAPSVPEQHAESASATEPQIDTTGIDPSYLDELFEASKSAHSQWPTPPAANEALMAQGSTEQEPPVQEDALHPAASLDHEAPLQSSIDPHDLQFVRHANKRMFWRKKSTRTILGLLALVFFMALTAQMAIWQRHALAAINPTSKAWMQALCIPVGCTIVARADIDALSIDSSSFQIISPRNYTLSWTLFNSSHLWTQTPSLEVVLLDKAENVVIQQVFSPQELGQAPEIAPQTREPTTQGLQIASDQPEITGYRLRIFYP